MVLFTNSHKGTSEPAVALAPGKQTGSMGDCPRVAGPLPWAEKWGSAQAYKTESADSSCQR